MHDKSPLCPLKVRTSSQAAAPHFLAVFHIFAVQSRLAVATLLPSGEKAMLVTAPVWRSGK